MLLGFYDLYKNIPAIHEFLENVLGPVAEWIEAHVYLRMSILLGYIVASSSAFAKILAMFFSPVIIAPISAICKLLVSTLSPLLK